MMQTIHGVGASSGIALAPIVVLSDETVVVPDIAEPMNALADASAAVSAHLSKLSSEAEAAGRADAAEVLNAQSLMAEDTIISDGVEEKLAEGLSFGDALDRTAAELEAMLASLDDPYLAARSADVGEIAQRLRRQLAGLPPSDAIDLSEPSILCARTITAAETAQLDPHLVKGFATIEGGPTSHVAIIARALGVPAVVGAPNLIESAVQGALGALDGTTGEVIIEPDDETVADFEARAAVLAAARRAADEFRGVKVSYNGSSVHVSANVAAPADIERAVAEGADGVGLMRTEFLYLDRAAAPTEDEQVEHYSTVLKAFTEPVVIRTFDIGGDKPADFLKLDPGENPFLGVRGVRLYEQLDELFITQLRALLRAAVHGDLWVMIPMVSIAAEVTEIRAAVERARTSLVDDAIEFGTISLGIMIEVPSAALIAHELAPLVDFFSIGTNDLVQYTMAADRGNGELDHLQDPLHPAVQALCRTTAEAGLASGRPVSVCGLAASIPEAAELFVEMGISKLSVSPPSVNMIKATVHRAQKTSA